jgi:hypothetical protein
LLDSTPYHLLRSMRGLWAFALLFAPPLHTRNHHPRRSQVDLYCECPLWPDDGMCSLRDCSVCECEEHEIPEPWRKAEAVEACDSEPRR